MAQPGGKGTGARGSEIQTANASGTAAPPDARTQRALDLLSEVEALAAKKDAAPMERTEGEKETRAAELSEGYDAVCSRFI